MRRHDNPNRQVWGPVGRCIYCDRTDDLTREHVLPFSLGGNWVLQKASCPTCRDLTRDLEEIVTRDMLGTARLQFNYPTRHKRQRPSHIPLRIKRGGKMERVSVPIANSPTLPIGLPMFDFPRVLTRSPSIPLLPLSQIWLWRPPNNEYEQRLQRNIKLRPGDQILGDLHIDPAAFLRVLCKIGFAAAAAHYGLDNIPLTLRPYILGENRNLNDVAGKSDYRPPVLPGKSDQTTTYVYDAGDKLFLMVLIDLFRPLDAPTYSVVVGEISVSLAMRVRGLDHPLDNRR
jgi:hypothetical protein